MRKNPISKSEVEKIEYIIDDIKSGKLILDHPLQRYSDNWGSEQKGNLIRRVLHDGQFLPILICTQYDEYGCEVRYLIDGVQRISTFDSFIADGFSISKNIIDYEVTYDGILYETKDLKSGKFALKKDRNKNLIPILDDDGNMQKRVQTIDIRGLKYSELPPELQEKIKRYLVSVQLKLECTDEDIQIEILDYNSGTKMNDAQIGKNRLGVEFAKIVIELSNHSFIKNKCGFTPDNRTKGVIDRAINEALMLVNFGTENWVTSHKDLCRKLSNWLTVEHTDALREMFDDLDEILPEDKEIKSYLALKEFFVIMANYKHFMEGDYKKECYAMFLSDFAKKLALIKNIPTGEVDDDGNDIYGSFKEVYMTGTKQKGSIQERLEKMNEMLDIYLEENCSEYIEDGEEDETTEETQENSIDIFVSEFKNTKISNDAEETALKTLMQFTPNYPARDFTKYGVDKFKDWLKNNVVPDDIFEDCLTATDILNDYLFNSNTMDKFSDNDIAILIYQVHNYGEDIDDKIFESWLSEFDNYNKCEQKGDSAAILEKDSYLRENYINYINK